MNSISIAMATYNGERYLREQLDSILAQTVSFQELIICDDASIDGTWSILSEYAKKDHRIKILRNEHNIGFLKNFERVLKLCTGDFVALSDQDDIWLPEHLEILLNGIGNKMLIAGDAEIIDADGKRTGKLLSYCTNLDYVPDSDLDKAYFLFFYTSQYHGMTMLMRNTFLKQALPVPEGVNYHDVWFGSFACFYGGMQYVRIPVTLYRRLDTSVSGVKRRKPKIKSFIGHLFFDIYLKNRPIIVSAIRERLADTLTDEQQTFLDKADVYYARRKSFLGRFINLFFEISHCKLIYSIK